MRSEYERVDDDDPWRSYRPWAESSWSSWSSWSSRRCEANDGWYEDYEDGWYDDSWEVSSAKGWSTTSGWSGRGLGTPAEIREQVEQRAQQRDHSYQRWEGEAIRRRGKDPPCPAWDAADLTQWPQKRIEIDRWTRLTTVPAEELG